VIEDSHQMIGTRPSRVEFTDITT